MAHQGAISHQTLIQLPARERGFLCLTPMLSYGFPYTSSGICLATEKLNSGSKAGRSPSSTEEEGQSFTGSAFGIWFAVATGKWQSRAVEGLGKEWSRSSSELWPVLRQAVIVGLDCTKSPWDYLFILHLDFFSLFLSLIKNTLFDSNLQTISCNRSNCQAL